jgi:vacuolar-type H+-ATPase subunit H
MMTENKKSKPKDIKKAIRRAQERVRRYVPEGVNLADELIAERRAEARREDEE